MFISDKPEAKAAMARTGFAYLLVTLFCAAFGAVYESLSHGVYSYFMLYAFAFPLCGGALPFTALSLGRGKRLPGFLPRQLYHFAIAALTVGSLMTGVLEIYGTTNDLLQVYWYAGALLLLAALAAYAAALVKEKSGARRRRG